jgi:two-component system nitrogen regulation response regulator NtrX
LDGLEFFKQERPEVVLLDVKMPGIKGLDLLKQFKESSQFAEVIMISGHSGISEAISASKLGAFDFLEKPISRDKLLLTVNNALEKVKLLKENYNLKTRSLKKYQLVGDSEVMQSLRESIKKVAKSDSYVLIHGESGTGKELIARQIHLLSKYRRNRFIQVNCAAIPEELIESELFGHEKGSFTGASEKKIGKFETANNGTLFLDEIGDLSLRAQAKVLRALEEGEVQRVGSSEIKNVDVRVIAATNKDLKKEIKKGGFREDLYFRLNVIPLYSPALREHLEDIPLLVEHFIDYLSQENNFKQKEFSEEVIEIFREYEWKGNVRELRNLVERLMIMTGSRVIRKKDLPEYLLGKGPGSPDLFSTVEKWKDFKQQSEKQFLQEKLKKYNYNIARTGREIGIPRSNLYKKIEQYGIIVK